MVTAANAERIRQLRRETVAAIDQRARLAHRVRGELLRLVADGLICRDGAAQALQEWGLEPMPRVWTVAAEGRLRYRHTGPDRPPGDGLYERVLDLAHHAMPTVWLRVGRATGPDDSDPIEQPNRLMMPAMLCVEVTTGDQDPVLVAAQQWAHQGLPALTDSGITLIDLAWNVLGEPREPDEADLLGYIDIPAEPLPVPPHSNTDLPTAIREREAAVGRLDGLRRRVRDRALRALRDDEIGADPQEAADILEPVMIRLGLGALPRAHQVTVVADLTLRASADSADDAFVAAYDVMSVFVERSDRRWRWQRSGCTRTASPPSDGDQWLVPWRLEYTTPVRGHLAAEDATAAAEASLRAALSTALGTAGHEVTVTARCASFGVDFDAEPSTN